MGMKPGPKKGYKQSPEHIAKKSRWGAEHHAWKGDDAIEKSGRSRALRKFPRVGPCVKCGKKRAERHHVDGNTLNNDPSNIVVLCRKCHMQTDGRLEQFRTIAVAAGPKARAARWNKTVLPT